MLEGSGSHANIEEKPDTLSPSQPTDQGKRNDH